MLEKKYAGQTQGCTKKTPTFMEAEEAFRKDVKFEFLRGWKKLK